MEPSPEAVPSRQAQSPGQRTLLSVGLVVIASGLALVVSGFAWGQLAYTSERPLELMQQQAAEALNGQQPDGMVISGAEYVPRTYVETSLAQLPTWLGGLSIMLGVMLVVASVPRSPAPRVEVAPSVSTAINEPDDSFFTIDE